MSQASKEAAAKAAEALQAAQEAAAAAAASLKVAEEAGRAATDAFNAATAAAQAAAADKVCDVFSSENVEGNDACSKPRMLRLPLLLKPGASS